MGLSQPSLVRALSRAVDQHTPLDSHGTDVDGEILVLGEFALPVEYGGFLDPITDEGSLEFCCGARDPHLSEGNGGPRCLCGRGNGMQQRDRFG